MKRICRVFALRLVLFSVTVSFFILLPSMVTVSFIGADSAFGTQRNDALSVIERLGRDALSALFSETGIEYPDSLKRTFSLEGWGQDVTGAVIPSLRHSELFAGAEGLVSASDRYLYTILSCLRHSVGEGSVNDMKSRARALSESQERGEGSFIRRAMEENTDVLPENVHVKVERGEPEDLDLTRHCLTVLCCVSRQFDREGGGRLEEMTSFLISAIEDIASSYAEEGEDGFWTCHTAPSRKRWEETKDIFEWVRTEEVTLEGETVTKTEYLKTGEEVIPHLDITFTYYTVPSSARERYVFGRCGITDEEMLLDLPDGRKLQTGISRREIVLSSRNALLVLYGLSFTGSSGGVHLPRDMSVCRISCPYGTQDRYHPQSHDGTDIASGGREDMGVFAVADGVVSKRSPVDYAPSFRSDTPNYGNYILIDHPNGVSTLYAHMACIDPLLVPGTPVEGGRRLGTMGSTGYSTGIHLHFETRVGGVRCDPVLAVFDGVSIGALIYRRDVGGSI